MDLLEEMLFQRADKGIRPVLYLSSVTDLECSMLTLLSNMTEVQWSTEQKPSLKREGYHIVTN